MDDVKNRVCDLGILYLSHENEVVMRKVIEENHLVFTCLLYTSESEVFLDMTEISEEIISNKLSGLADDCMTYLHKDIRKEPAVSYTHLRNY